VKNVIGLAEFVGKGVFTGYEHPEQFRDKRVLVVEFDRNSVEFALELTKVTGRVILLSPLEQLAVNDEQAELVEVSGGSEVEKVRIHDLDEDEEYDLVVDAVVVPP
jgi:nitrogen fixation NifU-like protein